MPLIKALLEQAGSRPNQAAMIFLDDEGREYERLTFAGLAKCASALARMLAAKGYNGSALLLFGAEPAFPTALYACQIAGLKAVPLPLPPSQTSDTYWNYLADLISDTEATVILSSGASAAVLAEQRMQLGDIAVLDIGDWTTEADPPAHREDGDEPLMLLYTSGSTSAPKGVPIAPKHLLYNAQTCCAAWDVTSDSVLISWMPNHHSFGLIYNMILARVRGLFSGFGLARGFFTGPGVVVSAWWRRTGARTARRPPLVIRCVRDALTWRP